MRAGRSGRRVQRPVLGSGLGPGGASAVFTGLHFAGALRDDAYALQALPCSGRLAVGGGDRSRSVCGN